MNDENMHPNLHTSSMEMMDLLRFHNFRYYNTNLQMFMIDSSILARDNINNFCINSMRKNFRIVHYIRVHLLVGYDYYKFHNSNGYSCIETSSTKRFKFS